MQTELQETRTKIALGAAMQELLWEKPLEQIRVRELADRCGIRRQSFYYHFNDVYELLDWSISREREHLLRRQEEFVTWQQVYLDLQQYMAENRAYYQTILRIRGRERLRELLAPVFQNVMDGLDDYYRKNIPEDMTAQMEKKISLWRENRTGLAWILIEAWINGNVDITPEVAIRVAEDVMGSMVLKMLVQTLLHRQKESSG